MFKIKILNNIAKVGLQQFPRDQFELAQQIENPHAIIVRSHAMHSMNFPESLLAVARAGAGVNNIPVEALTHLGVPVFNTPGANANAVKELVIAALLIAYRNIAPALSYVQSLATQQENQLQEKVEAQKKQFTGQELPGKKLAVIGLGAIGVEVANACAELGMNVAGFDPAVTVARAWQLSSKVTQAQSLEAALANADVISIHVPYNQHTHHLINTSCIMQFKPNAMLLNFSRANVVDSQAVLQGLADQNLKQYVCDFPMKAFIEHPQIICLPHLGASTQQAEENCASMAAQKLKQFLIHGNIENSVNYPTVQMPRKTEGQRLTIANANIPNMVGQISAQLATEQLNILDMINQSRGEVAYTIVDVAGHISQPIIDSLRAIDGILKVRVIS
ncbi:MAG: 3-phosphoglycerate dehydrogenase [Legionellales bacterium]|nr:3-phosphoglycerate dehydrogenase [Legionellales bacterium]